MGCEPSGWRWVLDNLPLILLFLVMAAMIIISIPGWLWRFFG